MVISYKPSTRWYTLAANNGHEKAALYLADIYASKNNPNRNVEQASYWYKVAVRA